MMSEKRFEVVLNEFDEVEYIMDKKLCEDKDFAEFMDFVEELAKENEQLKKRNKFLEEMIDELNKLNHTCDILRKNSKKLEKLLYERIKPTCSDDVYLDIDEETGRCKYENTDICLDFKCDYYSTHFLDCRLMIGDKQLRKAKELGLLK